MKNIYENGKKYIVVYIITLSLMLAFILLVLMGLPAYAFLNWLPLNDEDKWDILIVFLILFWSYYLIKWVIKIIKRS